MREVFLDASFWIAARADNQPEHRRALTILRDLAKERRRLIATHLIFAEIHAFFSRHRDLRQQVLHDFFEGDVIVVEPVTAEDYHHALELLRRQGDKEYSFCDAVSFMFMRRRALRQVLSFDRHFQQVGEFEILN